MTNRKHNHDQPIPPHLWDGGKKRRVRRPKPGKWDERFWLNRADECFALAESEGAPPEMRQTLRFIAHGCVSMAASLQNLDNVVSEYGRPK